MKIKKKIFNVILCFSLLFAISSTVYATVAKYRYSNGYVMEYQLYAIKVGTSGSAGAITETKNDAKAFVAIFGYSSTGAVKNSGTKTKDLYASMTLSANGSTKYTSTHSLLYHDKRPVGTSLKLNK